MLSAQFMGAELDVALSEFRESHSGTLSSMTRFRTHLDDMPAAGTTLVPRWYYHALVPGAP